MNSLLVLVAAVTVLFYLGFGLAVFVLAVVAVAAGLNVKRRRAARRDAVAEALASVRAEGLEPSHLGLELLDKIATGEISEDDAVMTLSRHYLSDRS